MSASCWSSSTRSPTATCHATISASEMPSPMSGSLKVKRAICRYSVRFERSRKTCIQPRFSTSLEANGGGGTGKLVPHDLLQRFPDPHRAGEVCPFQTVRIGRVEAGHPLNRRLEMVEAAFLDECRKLGAEAAGARRLVHDH